jgi:primosomal protein N' (replication factor Y)
MYHGRLPPAERQRAWQRIQSGEAAIVIGTRSAAFAPVARLGLIIVDQEDHPAYKGENVPRYDARVIAAERARRNDAALILTSAHPSLESLQATGGQWDALGAGSGSTNRPPVSVVDLREAPAGTILSATMTDAITARLAVRKKVVLFLNRKGYAPVLLCRDCGQAVRCPACAVGWTFHKHTRVLRCPHCGLSGASPDHCPACAGTRLAPAGIGTEAVEEAVRMRFPTARVARLEQEGRTRKEATAILSLMQAGELDILVGTQLLVTRSPKPIASLIGFIYPDAALHLPDFRAAERAYHTSREVMALADPHDPDAAIVTQTHVPQHHVIRALARHEPAVFYESELSARATLGYPPFGHLIGLRVSGTREDLVEAAATRWAALLKTTRAHSFPSPSKGEGAGGGAGHMEVLGPIPASPRRLRGRVRWQLVVKGPDGAALRQIVRTTLSEMETAGRAGNLRFDVDVDPQSLLD